MNFMNFIYVQGEHLHNVISFCKKYVAKINYYEKKSFKKE